MIQGLVNARKTQDAITELLTFVLVILISTFVLRFLWNQSLVKHVTVLKKLEYLPRRFHVVPRARRCPWYLNLAITGDMFTI